MLGGIIGIGQMPKKTNSGSFFMEFTQKPYVLVQLRRKKSIVIHKNKNFVFMPYETHANPTILP